MKKLIPLLLLLTACSAEKRFNDYSIKHPDQFKSLAAVLAPCVDVNPKLDTIYRSKTDTLITPGNTIIERRNDTVFVTKQLPGRVITKTEVQTVTKTVADSRAIEACQIETLKAKDDKLIVETKLKNADKAKSTWMWIALSGIFIIVLFSTIKIYTWLKGGWLKGVAKS